MIVSASYRTDIPAFYGAWFLNRLEAGFCRSANPYGGPALNVALTREAVDGFVFWTRNAGPFLPVLDRVAERGFTFVLHYTITGYPRVLETAVPDTDRAVALVRAIAARYGARAVVWRYDPILLSTTTAPGWHRANFAHLAASLAGACDEVVVSFAQLYRKTRTNLAAAAVAQGFAWHDPPAEKKRDLLSDLTAIAGRQGMAHDLRAARSAGSGRRRGPLHRRRTAWRCGRTPDPRTPARQPPRLRPAPRAATSAPMTAARMAASIAMPCGRRPPPSAATRRTIQTARSSSSHADE